MITAPADSTPSASTWDEAVQVRRAAVAREPVPENSAAELVTQYFATNSHDESRVREWANALRRPLEAALDSLKHQPERAATLLAPVVADAIGLARKRRQARLADLGWRWLTGLTSPRIWRWTLEALWEGEPVWSHVEKKALWYEVPEAMLFDNATQALLCKVESQSSRLMKGEPGLEEMCGLSPSTSPTPWPEVVAWDDEMPSRVTVLVGRRSKLAARMRGPVPPQYRNRLQSLLEEADVLLENGALDSRTRLDMLRRVLLRCLLKEGPSSRLWTRPSRQFGLALGGLSAACVLVWAGTREYRWHELVEALNHEPGVTVLAQNTAWGRREISGLRDPMARDPEEVARTLGLSGQDITLSFKPYVSAEEPFVTHRALPSSSSKP